MSNNSPEISIVMPVYNSAEFLCEAIDSLLKQSFKDFEIIFVDDGSTDNSTEIIAGYINKDSRLSLVKQDNRGAGAARNTGMDYARGSYILFLDSDDFFESTLLEMTYQRAVETKADIVIYASRLYNSEKKEFESCDWAFQKEDYPFEVFSYKDNPDRILNSFQLCPWNKLFKKSFVEHNNIRWQEIQRTNDFYFCSVAMILAKRISLVDKILVNYRINNKASLQATNYKNPLDFYKAVKKLYDFLREKNLLQEIEKSYYTRALRVCLYNLGANIRSKNDDGTAYVYEFLKYFGFKELGITDYIMRHPNGLDEAATYNRIMNNSLLHVLPEHKKLTRENIRLEKHIKRKDKEITNIKKSLSYRVGRVITYVPRKLRDYFTR